MNKFKYGLIVDQKELDEVIAGLRARALKGSLILAKVNKGKDENKINWASDNCRFVNALLEKARNLRETGEAEL